MTLAFVIVALIIISALILLSNHSSTTSQSQNVTVGMPAPNYGFFLANGSEVNINTYRGKPVLLWFVATWCSSCAQGNEVINQNYNFFKSHGITIVELELYKDLGYSGPPIADFVDSYALEAYSNGTVVPALAGYNMTAVYDLRGYLDIYYLLASNGTVLYINGSPSATLSQLEQAINNSM